MAKPIRIYGDEVLRRKASPVEKITPELVDLAREMLQIMYDAPGIGLAAPQIGIPIRLIVVDCAKEEEEPNPFIFFNPEIQPEEEDNALVSAEEGCLSVPNVWADVERPEKIRLKAQNEAGEWIEMRNLSGLFSRCLQHEVDHLEGKLFVDRISDADLAKAKPALTKMATKKKRTGK